MRTFKNLCCLLVVGWVVYHVAEYFQPEPPAVIRHERVTQIIVGDPHGGPDRILWPLPEEK